MTHLIITTVGGQRIDKWTDAPEVSTEFWRAAGAYVFEGGLAQPAHTDTDIDTRSAFASRR